MGSEKKGVKRFKKGVEKARKKGTDVSAGKLYNKGARSRPRQIEKEMEDYPMAENVIQVNKHKKKGSYDSVSQHRQDLEKLEEMDPEFFDFLKKNDSSLLDFGLDEDEEEQDDSEDEEDEDDDEEPERKERKMIQVTEDLLKQTMKSAQKGSMAALKRLMAIFRAACMPYGEDSHTSENLDENDGNKGVSSYQISSSDIFEFTLQYVLEGACKAFNALLDLDSAKSIDSSTLESLRKHKKWKKAQLLVLSFFKSYMTVLGGAARSSTSGNIGSKQNEENPMAVAVYLLQVIDPYIHLLAPLPRLAKTLLKILLFVWSEGPDPAEDDHNLRARSYLRIRRMSMVLPGSFTEECFRCVYLTFTRVCKSFTEYNEASVLFMIRCVVELYQTDILQSYQQGFLYIRQLALHLRTAVMKKTSENTRLVTSWQFINCLRLWTRAIAAAPNENELGALAFPLSQIMHGVIALAQSVYLLPLRFHLVICIQHLASSCRLFIPTAHKLLEILELSDIMTAKPTPSTDIPPRLQYMNKIPAGSVTRAPVRDAVVLRTIELLRCDAEVYRYSAGFPEYVYLTIRKIKAFAKAAKVSKWRDMARTTVSQLEEFNTEAKRFRSTIGLTPSEVTGFEPLLPVGTPCSYERVSKLMKSFDLTASKNEASINLESTSPAADAQDSSDDEESGSSVGSSDLESSDESDASKERNDESTNSTTRKGTVNIDRLRKLNMSEFFD
eukprot:GSChrysophyteH1.ASY1.ANO1.481.1 assembled CDS